MTGGELTHTLVSLRDGLRSACAPCAARDARAAKRNFGDPAGGKSGWFRGGFKIVKGSLPQAEFKVVKVSDLLENQPPPYAPHGRLQGPGPAARRARGGGIRNCEKIDSQLSKYWC